MAPGSSKSNKKVANSLVMLSSAAILAVYSAGFVKTRAAAQRLDEASNNRRPVMPAPATAGELSAPDPIEPPTPARVPDATSVVATSPAVRVPKMAEADAKPAPRKAAPAKSASATPVASAAPTVDNATPAPTPTVAPAAAIEKPEETPAPALKMPKEHYNDGTYLGWGTSRHGDIQASVTIEGGRFVSAAIAQCWTRYSCSWVSHLPPQVVTRQSPDVDYVSGATQSANAFYWAVIDALKKAK